MKNRTQGTSGLPANIFTAKVAFTIALAAGLVSGQDAPVKVTEPEFNMVFFALDAAAGTLLPLERGQANTQAKVRAFGYGGVNGLTVFAGENSPVRFKEGQKLQFVFRFDSAGVDPSTLVTLEALNRNKGKRELKTFQARIIGKTGTTNGESSKSLNFARYGEHSWRVSPAEPLAKGEYVLMARGAQEGFLFGID
jgi:hypothetical protein